MLDLRQLRYFVAVADAEHVGRAAEALHISQSPLSRQIMQLEAQLGLSLFKRSKQRLRLNAEGREFLVAARKLLLQAERLEDRGHQLAEGTAGALSIGYVEGAVHAGLISATLRRFRMERPAVRLHLSSQRSFAQIDGLRQHALDVGFIYTPPVPGDPEVASTLVLNEPLILALPAGDGLLERPKIRPQDVGERTWVTVVRQPNDTNREQFVAACAHAGFVPNIAYETTDPLTSLGLVSAGLGIAVVQASLRTSAPAGVEFRDLPWFDRSVNVHLAWRRGDERPAIAAFVEAATAKGSSGYSR